MSQLFHSLVPKYKMKNISANKRAMQFKLSTSIVPPKNTPHDAHFDAAMATPLVPDLFIQKWQSLFLSSQNLIHFNI